MNASRPESRARAALIALGLLAALAAAPRVRADETLPAQVQASVFKRIFAYDPVLRGAQRIKVLVLHGRLSTARASELAAAFEREGITAAESEVEVPSAVLDGATVLYALPDVPTGPLADLALRRRFLTLSGDAESCEKGRVAVALRRRPSGQPEILVHLPRLAAEGHELSARLLKLATVLP